MSLPDFSRHDIDSDRRERSNPLIVALLVSPAVFLLLIAAVHVAIWIGRSL